MRIPQFALALLVCNLLGASDEAAGQGVSRADTFIRTFGPPSRSTAMRASQLEQEEQVRLAFYGIDSNLDQIRSGKLTEKEGNFIIDGFEQTIRNYLHDKQNEALITASQGQASDVAAIGRTLQGALSVARQDGLMGHEELAIQAQQQMVAILTTFSQKFAETCEQQSFPVALALELERQNQLMGTGVSVEHCAKRKRIAEMEAQGVHYHFEQCSVDGTGAWDVEISGKVIGSGRGRPMRSGPLDTTVVSTLFGWDSERVIVRDFPAHPIGAAGHLSMDREIEIEEETAVSAASVSDSSPLAVPNHWPAEPATQPSVPVNVKVLKLRTTIISTRGGYFYPDLGTWIEGTVVTGENPCSEG